MSSAMKTILQEIMKSSCHDKPITEEERTTFPHISHLQRYHPGIDSWDFSEVSSRSEASLPHPYQIVEWKGRDTSDSRILSVTLSDVSNQQIGGRAFIKTVHLLDPITLLRNEYKIPSHPLLPVGDAGWKTALLKLHSTSNQAYIDAIASFVLGQLRHRGLTPHGCMSYGTFTGIATDYRYKITDEYESYRNCRWFWRGLKAHGATIEVDVSGISLDCPFEDLEESEIEELETGDIDIGDDRGSLHSFDAFDTAEEEPAITIERVDMSVDGSSEDEDSDEDSESEYDSDEESDSTLADITLKFSSMPVILICQEAQEGILDNLLDLEEIPNFLTNEIVRIGTDKWDPMWLAWLFQIIANLSFLQKAIAFTHNDLHTNNIVWRRTDQEFLYYKSGMDRYGECRPMDAFSV